MRDDLTKDHSPSRSAPRRPRKKFAPLAAERKPAEPAAADAGARQRIAKVMARAGACSRRDAEAWISEGRVALNGVVLTNPAVNVGDDDEITVDGAPLARRAPTRLFMFHKPRGLVTTERDPEGRQTIFDYLRENWPEAPRLVSIGRLDINTEGLLLLTNDGGLARVLELPSTGWVRRYRVRAKGATDQSVLDQLRQGVSVEGVDYAEIEAKLDRVQGANSWLTMGLREGKNREIKRVLEHLGLEVNRLIRLSFGPFQLADLDEGGLIEVRPRVLRDQLGPTLAEAAGVDFSEPVREPEAPPPDTPRPRAARPREDHARNARPERGAPARRQRPLELPPREQRTEPRKKPTPGPRKHISALREAAEHGSPRKRVERSATADRSGRTVAVERVVPVQRARGKNIAKAEDRREEKPASRNGRRFEAERKTRDDAPERARQPRKAPYRAERSERAPEARSFETPRRDNRARNSEQAERPRRPYDGAKDRSRTDARPVRGAGAKRSDDSSRSSRSPRSQSHAGFEETRAPKRSGDRPAKSYGQKSAGPRSGAPSGKGPRRSASDARPGAPASGFRGKDQRPGGKGGAPNGKPRGAPGRSGGPSKGRPRGKS